MKILMLGWELPPHNSGGLGVACLNLSKSLAKMGADIDFVVPYEAEHHLDFMRVLSATRIDPLNSYGCSAYDTDNIDEKLQLSIELARASGVPEEIIIHSVDELDEFFMSDKPFVL